MEENDKKDIALQIPGILDISNSYLEDFQNEINEILGDVELDLVNIEMDPGNKESLNSIYCSFHTIRGLLGLLNNSLGTKIAISTEQLLEAVKKYSYITSEVVINLLLDSIKFIKAVSNSPSNPDDAEFSGQIERHINMIMLHKDDILLEVSQSCKKESRIGKILVQEDAIDESDIEEILEKQLKNNKMKFGEIVLREKKIDASDIVKAIRMQKVRNRGSENQYVKIPLERLDQIISIIQYIGNIYDSLKDETVLRFGSNDSLTIESTRAYHMIEDIKNILKELRMVTLQQAFQKITRLVCSIIEENQLDVKFSTLGENIEVDKEISDNIALPLSDLIRLILSKAYIGEEKGKRRRIGNIEVVAYAECDTVHIDINGDVLIDVEDFKSDKIYIENMKRLNSIKCILKADNLYGEGIRVSMSIQR